MNLFSTIVKAVVLLLLSPYDDLNASANALENIALNKPATLSSEYGSYSTSGATNGDTDGVMNQNPYWNGIHTNSEINPWWKVDLEGNKYDFWYMLVCYSDKMLFDLNIYLSFSFRNIWNCWSHYIQSYW